MPILIPVAGASEDATIERLYAARSSMRVINESIDTGLESIDAIISITTRAAYSEVAPSNKVFNRKALSSIRPTAESLFESTRSIVVNTGDGFTIMADLLQLIFSGGDSGYLGTYAATEITAQLLVNGSEVAIKSFNFQVPTGRLGSTLNVVLADPDKTVVPAGASVNFNLLINGHSYPLMVNAKLQERESQVSYRGGAKDGPTDVVTFGALDVISDKFGLAPRRPVVMFDPSRVKYDEVAVKPRDAVQNEDGSPILPVIEPVFGLTMKQIIHRAYASGTGNLFISSISPALLSGYSWGHLIGGSGANPNQNGCGFTTVITNIPDYRVRRADFTIEGGWHDGAQPCVGMYGAVYFVEDNKLFIIDVDRLLPYGVVPHQLSLSDHKALAERIAYKPDSNAVLLTYQYSPNDPTEDTLKQRREVFTETTDENTDGVYSKIVTRRWDYEWFFPDDPTTVLATMPIDIEIETQQQVTLWVNEGAATEEDLTPIDLGVRTTHKESTHYIYEGDLLVSTHKVVQGIVGLGTGASGGLTDLLIEDTTISWTDDPFNPGTKLQDRVITEVQGIVVWSEDTGTYEGNDNVSRLWPVLLAQSSNMINDTSIVSTEMRPIKSVHTTLHHLMDKQFNVNVLEIDYLNGTVKRSTADPVTGSNDTSAYGSKSRSVIFRDLVSEAEIGPRIPVPVNSYELPRARAFELARNALMRLKNPLEQLPITLPGVDLVIRRGSIIQGQLRDGAYTPSFFVTGYAITGQGLGKDGQHRIFQTLEAIQLLVPE